MYTCAQVCEALISTGGCVAMQCALCLAQACARGTEA